MKKTTIVIAIIAFAALFITPSCRMKPPEEERMLAEKAFRDALSGKDCARENYLAAEELLNQAREAVNAKQYDKAKDLFLAAKKKADEIAEYVRTHPEECNPQAQKKGNGDEVKDAEFTEETVSYDPKNPNMRFPVIHFDFNEATIRDEDIPLIKIMAEWMTNFPEAAIRIEGHADERGSVDYNLSLGERRAQAVRDELLKNGIDTKRLRVVSYGEERPLDPRSTEEAWAKNRRAEFTRAN